jgi:hypothetical protein
MKKPLLFAACAVACLAASTAKADSTPVPDPVMAPKMGGGCGSTSIQGLTFMFSGSESSPPSPTSVDCFVGSAASPRLTVSTTLAPSQLMTGSPCGTKSGFTFSGSDLFSTFACNFDDVSNQLTVTWFGTGSDCETCPHFPGILPNVDFFMDFSGWSSSQSFTGELAVPEPGTAFLLTWGLSALLVLSRLKFAT